MKRSRQLIGIEVVDRKTGKVMGTIKDVVFMPGERKILGFVVRCGKWVKGSKVLFPDDIEHIGKDVILTKNKNVLQGFDKFTRFHEAIHERDRIFGLKVITDKGQELGYIDDILVNEEDCSIGGYILTDGFIEDILKGRLILPFNDNITFGEHLVIIENSCLNIMLINDISIKKIFKKEGDNYNK
jgi:uncharacterized protein YrrD